MRRRGRPRPNTDDDALSAPCTHAHGHLPGRHRQLQSHPAGDVQPARRGQGVEVVSKADCTNAR